MANPRRRVLMIGLDGCELSVAETMMAAGRLPALSKLAAESARYLLDHGKAKRTGLAWEHVSSGLSPDDAERWAAVDFDPRSYEVRQRQTNLTPFASGVDAKTVIVDAPYFDLRKTPNARGFVGWGAHDPGVAACFHPPELEREMRERFGDYAAPEWIYGFVWPSPEKTRRMADALIGAAQQRGDIALWLLRERLPDWELGLVVASEHHSAIEALWHGVDPGHPLHEVESAAPARVGIEGVYEASDHMIGRLVEAFPDAYVLVFNLHGMGANNSDVPSMALLSELLYRREFGRPFMRERAWAKTSKGVPLLSETEAWSPAVNRLCQGNGVLGKRAERLVRRLFGQPIQRARNASHHDDPPLAWMPATRYQPYWRRMRAFALPSFYDGRIRVNLQGREADGLVEAGAYRSTCDDLIRLLRECHCPVSGEPAVEAVEQYAGGDPLRIGQSDADLIVTWSKAAPLGLAHPSLGVMGPLPYRRTGGHTGQHGFAFIKGPDVLAGRFGLRSAFDVVPTVIDLLDAGRPDRLSGRSMLGAVV